MNNWDSYIEHGRNFYLYHEPVSDLFFWIPWDYNLAIGGDFFGGGGGGSIGGVVLPLTMITAIPDSTGIPTCYDYEYPVSVVDVDGNVLTASDDDSMLSIVFGNIGIEDFVYPINVIDTNTGQTLTANIEADVVVWIDDCN